MNIGTGELLILLGPPLFLLPMIIALKRSASSLGSVIVLNLALGWTVIGWVLALVVAIRSPTSVPAASQAPTPTGTPSPGWYPDPWNRHPWRYWDGTRWTAQVTTASGQVTQDA